MGNHFSDEVYKGNIFYLVNQKQLIYKALNKYAKGINSFSSYLS